MGNPLYCIHRFMPAINLANGYGYTKCVFCGATKPGWMTSLDQHRALVNATDDGRDYTPRRTRAALAKIKQQPFFK